MNAFLLVTGRTLNNAIGKIPTLLFSIIEHFSEKVCRYLKNYAQKIALLVRQLVARCYNRLI